MSNTLRRAPALIALYAVLLAYASVTLMPFAWMLITSFKESRDVFRLPPSFVPTMLYGPEPFANYTEVLTRHDFLLYFRNSFFVSTMAALGHLRPDPCHGLRADRGDDHPRIPADAATGLD